jgi:hypothetical protein
MPYRNEIFFNEGNHYFTTTDEWERVKFAAMQRARSERSQVAADIVRWIIRGLRNAAGLARNALSQQVARDPVQANR